MARSAVLRVVAFLIAVPVYGQPGATLQGQVFDPSGAAIRGATITVHSAAAGFDRLVTTGSEGRYHVDDVPPQTYRVTAAADGFKSVVIAALAFDVGRTVVRDFRLEIGDRSDTVVVKGETPLVDRVTTSVGHVMTARTVQELPLNGRHFTDLALLTPGAVAPSQTGFSAVPIRGVGAVAINTAGNREEASAFHLNGVSANNQTFGSLGFEVPIGSIDEFAVDNSPS